MIATTPPAYSRGTRPTCQPRLPHRLLHTAPSLPGDAGSPPAGWLTTGPSRVEGVGLMAAPEQDDSLADLRRELLEREARLESLLEQLLHGDQPQAPPETTAPSAPRAGRDGPMRLTGREVQILQLLVRGQTNRQIAAQLRLVPGTVRNRLSRIYQKLGVTTRTHAAVRAVELGLGGHDPAPG